TLFAELGFNGVSVRQICAAAGANLGALSYHFGTKENLFKEVVLRRARPMREERLQLLEALGEDATLEQIVYAMLEPAFRVSRENDAFRKLLGRASMDPTPHVKQLLAEVYDLDFMTVPAVLRRSL